MLGDTSAGYEAIDLDFDSSNYYLDVQVSDDNVDFETLSPRQRIVASGFAVNAETVHGGRFLNTSGVGQFAGLSTASYSRFGTATTTHSDSINSSNDLLISGALEVDGSVSFDGFVNFSTSASVTVDFEVLGYHNFIVGENGENVVVHNSNLPVDNKAYEKMAGTTPFRFGRDWTVQEEFDALRRLNMIDSKHFARPYYAIKDSSGNIVGYKMEFVEGVTAWDYIERHGSVPDHIVSKIDSAVRNAHLKGMAHGDLNSHNIIITDGGRDFKIIDPVGYKPFFQDLREAIVYDLDSIARLSD